MAPLYGRPKMVRSRTAGLRVGWRQSIHEKPGVGALWIDVLGEQEYQLCPVPRMYFAQLIERADAVEVMNNLLRMYGYGA